MSYSEGTWHAIVGLKPQYDRMKGSPGYDDYMRGYNQTLEEIKAYNSV